MLDELKAELSHPGAERLSSHELQTSKCKQEGWKNVVSCILAIVLIFVFAQLKLSIFRFLPHRTSSPDIIHKTATFILINTFPFRRWYYSCFELGLCFRFPLALSTILRDELKLIILAFDISFVDQQGTLPLAEKDEWLPCVFLGHFRFVI